MSSRPRGPFRPGHYKAQAIPAHPDKPGHAKRDTYDWVTLWTAMIGVAVVAAATVFTAYQALVTKQQLDAALSQQRPWVRIEIIPDGDLVVDSNGAYLPIKLRLTNVGPLPAVGAWTDTGAVPHITIPEVVDDVPDPPRGGMCDASIFPGGGMTVFPGETVERKEIVRLERRSLDALKGAAFDFAIKACVTYGNGASGLTHHTDRTVKVSRQWSVESLFLGFRKDRDSAEVGDLIVSTPHSGNLAD